MKRRSTRRPMRKPYITEATLRRIVRQEVTRSVLIQEGLLDSLKKPFKSLSDKIKKTIVEKSKEMMGKLKEIVKKISSGPMDEIKKFLEALKKQKGGVSSEDAAKQVPELAKLFDGLKSIKNTSLEEELASETPAPQGSQKSDTKSESRFRMDLILLSEQYDQTHDGLFSQKQKINEVVATALATVAATWWTFMKTLVGVCGLTTLVLKILEKICDKLGYKNVQEKLHNIEHSVHEFEEIALEYTAFPAPIQYAAYLAFNVVSGDVVESTLSYKEFTDENNKDGKKAKDITFKVLKVAILAPLLVDAVTHLAHSLHGVFNSFSSTVEVGTAAAHTGSESLAVGKTAAGIAKATGRAASQV